MSSYQHAVETVTDVDVILHEIPFPCLFFFLNKEYHSISDFGVKRKINKQVIIS